MTDVAVRALLSFLVTAVLFTSVPVVLWLIASAPAVLFMGILFGVAWAVTFSMVHVRSKQ